MGQRDIRRLLITSAVGLVRRAARKGAPEGTWLARMLAKKPRMLVAVALANRMARGLGHDAHGRGLPGSGGRRGVMRQSSG